MDLQSKYYDIPPPTFGAGLFGETVCMLFKTGIKTVSIFTVFYIGSIFN